MASRKPTTIVLTGPFFKTQPSLTFRKNVRVMLESMEEEGTSDVQVQYPVLTGAGQAGVVGRVHSLAGRPWALTFVISEQHVYPWPHGGMKQYRGGKTEARRHMYRTTASRLRKSRAVNNAELAKGLN